MQVDIDRLHQYNDAGRLRHSTVGDLHVWCYGPATAYNDDWDDITTLCRGLVTDNDGTVISLPFPKFFNWGQPRAPGPETTQKPFWAYDKMDGSLIIVGNRDGQAVVSTKGSFNTWHSEAAREMLSGWVPVEGSTALFEFIHPNNRIVVDYGDRESLVLLGAVAHSDRCDHFQPEDYAAQSGWFGDMAPPRQFNLQSTLRTVEDPENGPNREGFVLVWPNPEGPSARVKIKFAQYVHLHGVLSRLSNVAVWEALSTGTFDALLEIVPDELYDKVHECADALIQQHAEILGTAQEVADHVRSTFDTRREQAAFVQATAEHSGLVFKALDAKDADKAAWQIVKPERDTTWTFLK